MSRHNTLVVPGGKMSFAMELIMRPLIQQLIETGKIGVIPKINNESRETSCKKYTFRSFSRLVSRNAQLKL